MYLSHPSVRCSEILCFLLFQPNLLIKPEMKGNKYNFFKKLDITEVALEAGEERRNLKEESFILRSAVSGHGLLAPSLWV